MNDEIDSIAALGQRVKDIRTALKMSQKKLSEVLGISHNYISDIERGNANPGPEFFFKLFRELNIDLNYVFMGIGDMFYEGEEKSGEVQSLSLEEFDFTEDIDRIEQVAWLMVNSKHFKNVILGMASQIVLADEKLIKESIRRTRQKKTGSQDEPGEKSPR